MISDRLENASGVLSGQAALLTVAVILFLLGTLRFVRLLSRRARLRQSLLASDEFSDFAMPGWRSPELAIVAGLYIASAGVAAICLPGFALPAAGLFFAVVGARVVVCALQLTPAGERSIQAGEEHPDSPLNIEWQSVKHDPRVSWYQLHSQVQSILKRQYFQGELEYGVTLNTMILTTLDLIDKDEWNDARALRSEVITKFSGSRRSPFFWLVSALVNDHEDDRESAMQSLREAYRRTDAPPDWLEVAATDRITEGSVVSAWYTETVRRELVQSILEAQRSDWTVSS